MADRVKDNNFIQEKINQISKQSVIFRNFAEESISQSLKMCDYAEDLILFAECCDGISKEDLLEYLRSLSRDSLLYKLEATKLKEQIKNIENSLGRIAKEILKYNYKIIKERKDLSNYIDTENKRTNDAKLSANRSKIVAGLGLITAAVSIPLTGGASLVALGVSGLTFIGGAVTAEISTANANTSSNESIKLNYQLESVREEFSQYLREMRSCLENITYMISYCEFIGNIMAMAKKIRAKSEEYSLILEEFFK
ncbi:unnamed protein product [Rhizophagus irregularis]|uniref:Uncharacterized protein n=2 Tax=Rhizophagus irregularis TaxID=588596 RepID=A0A915ZHE1_9GLOM|nr:unnamed protein product [Rhizophagus irregularis]CAB5374433.1 unnamed protein product [Rhizophagus irregularis]